MYTYMYTYTVRVGVEGQRAKISTTSSMIGKTFGMRSQATCIATELRFFAASSASVTYGFKALFREPLGLWMTSTF